MISVRHIGAIACFAGCTTSIAADQQDSPRRPVAIADSDDGDWLYVANRDRGTVSVISTSSLYVENELDVGGRPADICVWDDSHLLVVDEQNHQVAVLVGQNAHWQVESRIDVAAHPRRIEIDRKRQQGFVTSLWSRAVSVIELGARTVNEVGLSFEPYEMCFDEARRKLIVAGSFESMLAVVDTESLEVITTKSMPGHNIRGLALADSGRQLLITQQELNPLARSTRDDVHWGNMISNQLVSLSIDALFDPESELIAHRVVDHLGVPGRAAGDPSRVLIDDAGELFIVLSGVNEVSVGDPRIGKVSRVAVGRRPIDVVSDGKGRLFVADTYSDSVSVVDLNRKKTVVRIALASSMLPSPEQLGEALFHDATLSHDGWMSCHSCHTDGHSNEELNDNQSDKSFDAPKRVLSLLGVGETQPWAWNGHVRSLHNQVAGSIRNTMQGPSPISGTVSGLTAYLKTLTPPPRDVEQLDSTDILAGNRLFAALGCRECHRPPTYTSDDAYDVGLQDELGNRKFNPPSLRGVAYRRRLFHDGRARSLEDVLLKYKHQLDRELTKTELERLSKFLESL